MAISKTLAARAKAAAAFQASLPKRVARRRPTDFRAEAIEFLSLGLKVLDEKKRANTTLEAALWLPLVFRNYCFHTGLRGKEKQVVWNHVRRVIQEAKSVESA